MRYVVTIAMAMLVLLLQLALAPHLRIFDVMPDFILVTSILWLLTHSTRFAVGWSVGCGIFYSLYDPAFFGLIPALLLIVLLVVSLIRRRFFPHMTPWAATVLVLAGTILYTIIYGFAIQLQLSHQVRASIGGNVLLITAVTALWNAVISLVLYRPISRSSGMLDFLNYRAGQPRYE